MEIEQINLSSLPMVSNCMATSGEEWFNLSSRTLYQRNKYANLKLATPVLRPLKYEEEIPPLEDFPEPAISLSDESSFELADYSM